MKTYIAIVTVYKSDNRNYSDQYWIDIYKSCALAEKNLHHLVTLGGYQKEGRKWKQEAKDIIVNWLNINNEYYHVPEYDYDIFFPQ